jgi:hypothetical protein
VYQGIVQLVLIGLCAGSFIAPAQDFKLFDREVKIHGLASQGFVYTNSNNWLTMNSNQGSGAFTDFGINMSASITDRFRVGAQLYDRNLGQLGRFHPSLDWAVADYRLRSWLGFRGGKVKTTLGLYTDSQDLDFIRIFALLPQSLYPTDLREATIAHLGGDLYGNFSPSRQLARFYYTVFAGHISDGQYTGFHYLAAAHQLRYSRYGGLLYGADLRWDTPLRGLLLGASRLNQNLSGHGTFTGHLFPGVSSLPESDTSKPDWTNQFYGQYKAGNLRIDSEYRRFVTMGHYHALGLVLLNNTSDVRGWYMSGGYRISKRLAIGSYYSRYWITSTSSGVGVALLPDQTDTSLPKNHVYDKVISARVDLKKFWNVKIEGHFMNGYGASTYPDGFYPQVNPQGYHPNTNALVVKTGLNF